MAEYIVRSESLVAIADKIRVLSGTEDAMGLDDMATNVDEANIAVDEQAELIAQIKSTVDSLPEAGSGEPVLQEKTVTPTTSSQAIIPDDGYDGLSEVIVNAIPSTYVEPTATKVATTYIPTTSNQTIAAGTYCSGAQTIQGDSNLIASNIKSGVSIFGVSGSYEGSSSGGDTPDSGSGGTGTGSGSNALPVGVTGFVQSTAEGSIIYTQDGSIGIETRVDNLTYLSFTKKYRFALSESLVVNTPIVVLTTGTITMPPASGYTATLIASGSGYAVYTYK